MSPSRLLEARRSEVRTLACAALVGIVGLSLCTDAVALMYQWRDPVKRTAQLSGTPPSWYRSEQGGPRVRVFDNGNLVDDTAIRLPRSQASELREAAFAEYEQRQRQEALRQLERAALVEQRQRDEERAARQAAALKSLAERDAARAGPPTSKVLAVPEDPDEVTPETVERLRALVKEFDAQGGDLRK